MRTVLATAFVLCLVGCNSRTTPTGDPTPPPEPKTQITKTDGKEEIVTSVPDQ